MGLYEVYVFGNGDYIAAIFNAIAIMVGGADYYGLVKLSGMLGILYVILQAFLTQRFNPQYIIFYAFVLLALLFPKVNIGIVDQLKPANNIVIGNVPLGVGIFAHFTSKIGEGITKLAETSFGLPDDIRYQDNGLAGSVSMMYSSKKFAFPPGNTKTDLDEFIQNCTFYEIAAGQKNIQELLRSQNILDYIATTSSRFTTIHPDTGTTTTVETCSDAYTDIVNRINNEYPVYRDILERTIFDEITGTLEANLSNVYNYLGNISNTGFDIIIQNSMINMVNESFKIDAELSGINLSLGALSVAQAEQQQRTSWFTTGALAKRVLPLLRSILEGLLYGLFPFVFILFLLPNGFKYIMAYITNLFWIQSWGFFFVILNLGINIAAKRDISAITDGLGYGLALIDHTNIYQTSADFINMSGAMAMAIPLLSLGIITGSGYAVVNSLGSMTGSTEGAASAAGHSIGTGNVSYGNMNANNKSFDNINAHKENMVWDTQIGSNASFYERTQSVTGDSIEQFGVDDNPAVSYHTGTGAINVSNASAITKAYNHSVNHATSEINTETQSLSNRFGHMINDMTSHANTEQAGISRGTSDNISTQKSYSDITQQVENTIRTEGVDGKALKDRANQITGAAALSAMLVGNGVKAQVSQNFRGSELDAYNEAVNQMNSIGASEILNDIKTYSSASSAGNTNSDSHAKTVSKSTVFNEAKELLGNLTESYSQLKNINEQYSEMRKDDFSISTQLTGDFNNWFREKYDNNTELYHEAMVNEDKGERLVYEYMFEKVFDGPTEFTIGPMGAAENKAQYLNHGSIENVEFEPGLKPTSDMYINELREDSISQKRKINDAYNSGGQAFFINQDDHIKDMNKEKQDIKDSANLLEMSEDIKQQKAESEINRKGKEIKGYKGDIISEEAQELKTNIKESMDEFTKKIFP